MSLWGHISHWLDQPGVNIFLGLMRQKEVWVEPEENRSGLGSSKESGENAWEGCLAYEMCIQNNHIRIPKKSLHFLHKTTHDRILFKQSPQSLDTVVSAKGSLSFCAD